jgi:glycosyltransferase involved in cell wall biosynthesis
MTIVMKSKTKKVCMLAYTQYTYDNRIQREAETLAAQGNYKVSLLVPKEGDAPQTYEVHGVRVRELNMQQYQGKSKYRYIASYLEFMLRTFFVCNELLLLRQADIFHIHNMPNFLVFSAILARVCGKKLILDIHDSVPETYAAKFNENPNKTLFWLLCCEEAICCRLAHKIICVNHPQRDALVSRGIHPAKITVSLNVPDCRWYKMNGRIKLDKRETKQFKLVYHGTLAKRLGVDLTIQAVGKLIRSIPEIEFHIYGGGDDKQTLMRLAEELKLQAYIHFYGFVPLDKLCPILTEMDLGVIGNRKNIATDLMLPVKMLEYIALNIPVVVPKLPTVQYYFSDEMVSYFEPEDSDELAASILALYQNREKRERQARSARKFLDQFGWEIHQKDFLDLYSRL